MSPYHASPPAVDTVAGQLPGFVEHFLARVAAASESVAIELAGEHVVLTYGELLGLTERLRGAFRELGVGEGDAVLMMLPSGPEFIAAFYALASLSAVAVPISPALTPFELAPILADARPRGAVVAGPASVAVLAAYPDLRFVLTTTEAASAARAVHLADLAARSSPLVPPAADTIVSCHFTYKGLGYPLGVLHRYASYSVALDGGMARWTTPGEAGSHLALLPQHPVYALVAGVLLPLSLGARLVVVRRFEPRGVYDLLAQHRIRFACLVPPLFRALAARPRPRGELHSHLQLLSGGSYLTPELTASVADAIGVEPLQGYGLSETLPATVNYPGRRRAGTLGVPIDRRVLVRIVDAHGRDVPSGRVGEIVVGGPTVMAGFLGRPRETERFLRDGWFHTGDLGHLDQEGFLHFDGRSLPITKCAAQMVDLVEIESLVRTHPSVVDARATVSVDAHGAERVALSIVMHSRASLTAGEVIDYCKLSLSRHKLPRTVRLLQHGEVAV